MQIIDAIPCVEYINGPYWEGFSQEERDDALGVLIEPKHQLCPNIETYKLQGFRQLDSRYKIGFQVIKVDNATETSEKN